ncbi:MAG: ATP-binding protein [Kiritimatiellales bacterium]
MKRLLQSNLEDMLRSDDQRIILLEGARQVGKSYLVNCALKNLNIPSFSFDLEKDRLFRRELDETKSFSDFRSLLKMRYGITNGSVLFIDESQESRTLARYIKSFKEDWPELKVLLTGSSMNRLFDEEIRLPVGRTRSLCLFGFSFSEFVQCVHGEDLAAFVRTVPDAVEPSAHRLLLELFDRYMQVGGYPEAVLASSRGEDFKGVIEEIIMTQEEDFARKEAYDPELFRMTMRAVANHVGSPSKYTHWDTTKYKARQVISAMKAWHLLLEVEVKSLDPERDGFLPKRYLHDPALINRFRAVAAPPLSLINTISPALRTPLGGVFENAVLIHLLNGLSAYTEIGTWKQGGNNGMEVDFILEKDSARIPVECKAALTLKRSHYSNILTYLRTAQQSLGLVVSAAPFETIETDGVRIINLPVYLANRPVIDALAEANT